MKLGVCAQVLYHLSFREALSLASSLGFEAIELPVDAHNPFIELNGALSGGWRQIQREIKEFGLEISALSNHRESQLLLGPHTIDTDVIYEGDAEAKIKYAKERLVRTAELAKALDVQVVCGFTGCEDYSRWFPWPLADGYDRMAPTFRERMLPILDAFHQYGIRFAHECHPRQFAYNLETARWALELLEDHPAFGFNFDPANLLLAGMDPVMFIVELGERILHVHAKDGELVEHRAARSGLLAHGPWDRRERGFRFRIPGWGNIPWKRLISELQFASYQGVLAVEHEDPTMSQIEGLKQAVQFLKPMLLREPMTKKTWW